jgi:hypothetical protein
MKKIVSSMCTCALVILCITLSAGFAFAVAPKKYDLIISCYDVISNTPLTRKIFM